MAERVPDVVIEAERWLRRRFRSSGALLSLDAYDRWGPKDEASRAKLAEDEAALLAERREIEAGLAAATAAVVAAGQMRAWAAAHVTLLEAYAASLPEEERYGTERYVAREEAEAWARARSVPVDQNPYYIRYDAELYEALFGFPPR